jgi:hypothetical protein
MPLPMSICSFSFCVSPMHLILFSVLALNALPSTVFALVLGLSDRKDKVHSSQRTSDHPSSFVEVSSYRSEIGGSKCVFRSKLRPDSLIAMSTKFICEVPVTNAKGPGRGVVAYARWRYSGEETQKERRS